ncbi:thermonuclease family protein [Clostridium sp. Mt-5]|uniref:Thermonuclease family protein n=1 Tax=Clostridium moutaii TaxID=3240932 RepID=A0ABV4BMS2_9CLOT
MKNKKFISKILTVCITGILLVSAAGCSDSSSDNKNVDKSTQTLAVKSNDSNKSTSQESKSPIQLEQAVVIKHIDGDTVYVKLENGQDVKVRFIGVNTPESTTEHEQYGEEASNYTKSRLLGKTVYLEKDIGDTDKYGRLLRYVWLSPPTEINESEIINKMFNAMLAVNGYAQQMTIQPNVKYADYFKKFCAEARENNKGLWSINSNGTTRGDSIKRTAGSASNIKSSSTSSGTDSSGESSTSLEHGLIKGNINSKGEKIYHMPGDKYYDKTNPEAWFNTEKEAQAAGYRKSKI